MSARSSTTFELAPAALLEAFNYGPDMMGAPWVMLRHVEFMGVRVFVPPPTPPSTQGHALPFLSRVPVDDRRMARFTEHVQILVNALFARGQFMQLADADFVIQGSGALTADRAPTATDDETRGVVAGCTWLNTATGDVYINTSVAAGAATWKLLA